MRILAEVPVLSEAQVIPSTFEELDMLLEDEGLLEKAKERIATAMEGSAWQYSDPFEGVLTFGLAVILLSQIRDERFWVRWVKAEARRVERFLNEADDETLKFVWTDLGIKAERCAPEEEEKMGLPYKIHSSDYLRLMKAPLGPEWLNTKRLYWDGWVYVTHSELIKLILNEVKLKMIEMVEKIPKVTDQRVAKAVFELRSLLIYMETQQKSGAVV
jgi:DNA primase large subunit